MRRFSRTAIRQFDSLVIAEANVSGTPLVGKTLADSGICEKTGCNFVAYRLEEPKDIPRSPKYLHG